MPRGCPEQAWQTPSPHGHCSIPGKQHHELTEKCWLGSREETLRFQRAQLESDAKPSYAGFLLSAVGAWPGWVGAEGPAVRRECPAAAEGCVHANLSAGERGWGRLGAELPGSILPGVLSELALL